MDTSPDLTRGETTSTLEKSIVSTVAMGMPRRTTVSR
jgi:hypothetical protein